MPLRSVLDVEVQDQRVDDLLQKLERIATFSKKEREEAAKDRAAERAASRTEQEQVKLLRQQGTVMEKLGREWKKMREEAGTTVRHVQEISSRMLSMVTSAAKISTAMGLVTGVATGFGFMGLESLGRTGAGLRRGSLGLGTSVGGMRAFGLDFGRFVDPGSVLSGVSTALRNPQQSIALRALGITPGEGEDTSAVAVRALRRVQELAKTTPETQLGTLLQSRRLGDLGLSLEDLSRLRRMSSGELNQQAGAFGRDRGTLDLTEGQLRKWQDFLTTVDRAKMSIETVFIDRLTPLAPAFGHLSESLTKLLETLLSKDKLGQWINDLATGVEMFATHIEDGSFEKSVTEFFKGVGDLAEGVVRALRWMHLIPGGADEPASNTPSQGAPAVGGWGFDWRSGRTRWHNTDGSWSDAPPSSALGAVDAPQVPSPMFGRLETAMGLDVKGRAKEAHDYFAGIKDEKGNREYSEDQIAGILGNLQIESGLNPKSVNAFGFQGIAQWDKERSAMFRRLFGHDPKDGTFQEQIAFINWEMHHTHKRALDALHATTDVPGATRAVMGTYEVPSPAEMVQSGPLRERAAQVHRQNLSLNDRTRAAHVHVTIRNETGGNMIVASGMLA